MESFSETLKTWEDDRPKLVLTPQAQFDAEYKPKPASSGIPPMPETPPRDFADHMDAARQHIKDWVRKELHLAMHGMPHEDRLKENP